MHTEYQGYILSSLYLGLKKQAVGKQWKQPKCLSGVEKTGKMCIHTMECHSALKRNKVLTHATTWINFENIMLSEISQTQKDKHRMGPLI